MSDRQRYVAHELTHFVGRDLGDDEDRYALLVRVLREGRLEPSSVEGVCFCDIPVADLLLHMGKYGRFGLAFDKRHLAALGATPILYVAATAPDGEGRTLAEAWQAAADDLRAALAAAAASGGAAAERAERARAFFERRVVGYLKPFDPALEDLDEENWYMEREWRAPGPVPFARADVARVVLPRDWAPRLREDVPDYVGQVTFAD